MTAALCELCGKNIRRSRPHEYPESVEWVHVGSRNRFCFIPEAFNTAVATPKTDPGTTSATLQSAEALDVSGG